MTTEISDCCQCCQLVFIEMNAYVLHMRRITRKMLCLFYQVSSSTLDFVRQKGVDVSVLQTEEAVAEYNKLASEGRKVGGVFHSTC